MQNYGSCLILMVANTLSYKTKSGLSIYPTYKKEEKKKGKW